MYKSVFEDPTRFTQLKFYVQKCGELWVFCFRQFTWPHLADRAREWSTVNKKVNIIDSKVLRLQRFQKSKYYISFKTKFANLARKINIVNSTLIKLRKNKQYRFKIAKLHDGKRNGSWLTSLQKCWFLLYFYVQLDFWLS